MAPTLEVVQKSNSVCVKQQLETVVDSMKTTITPFQMMLNKVDSIFNQADNSINVNELWNILEEYQSNPSDWAQYAYYDESKYKRNLVAEHEKYNVMIICWGPSSKSCIHDHSGSHCFMKVIDGELIESRFAWPVGAQEMCHLSDARMKSDDVLYINDDVGLHLIENPSRERTAASLHVYIPPYRKCKAFDQKTGQAQVCSLKFYSERGRVIKDDTTN